jgi:hypothetical protein
MAYRPPSWASWRRRRRATPRCRPISCDAQTRRTALCLARRQHAVAAQARHFRQHRGGARGHRALLPEIALERCLDLCRSMAGEGRARRCRAAGDGSLRRPAHGRARLRKPVLPSQRRRDYPSTPAACLHLPSRTSSLPASMPARRSSRPCGRWRQRPKSTSSGLPLPRNKSTPGAFPRALRRPATAGREASVTSQSNSTPSTRRLSATS